MFFRKTLLLNISWCFCERLRVKRARFLRLLNVLLTAQPQACAGLVLHGVLFHRAAVGWAVYARQGFFFFFFFFSFVGDQTQTSARPNAGRDI